MERCAIEGCHHRARFYMCWSNGSDKHCGMVCATHDRTLGRQNLSELGWTVKKILLFERYCKETVNSSDPIPWEEWLQIWSGTHLATLKRLDRIEEKNEPGQI